MRTTPLFVTPSPLCHSSLRCNTIFHGHSVSFRPSYSKSPAPSLSCTKNPVMRQPTPSPSRRSFLHQFLSLTTLAATTTTATKTLISTFPSYATTETDPKVFFDVSVAGKPKGRITIVLDAVRAPATTRTFTELASGTLRNRAGRSATYNRSVGTRVIRGECVYLGKLNQIDAVNQSPGTPQRQQPTVDYPYNIDENDLVHDRAGVVSVAKGGSFEFGISVKENRKLDADELVIGYVVDGMNVVNDLVNIPTNRKTIRDGYRNIGKAIGDPRANVQLEDKPLQKIVVTNCGVL